MRFSHGAYFHVETRYGDATWTRLSADLVEALALHREVDEGRLDRDTLRQRQHLIPLADCRLLPTADAVKGPGVYFLWAGDALAYVGRSNAVARRVCRHKGGKINFDAATALACDLYESLKLEALYIANYRPTANQKAY
jgi:hypothetical protein